jgi:hypothetical protein
MAMLDILNKPYPFNDDLKHNSKIVFFISVGVVAFLLLFQPLGINAMTMQNKSYLIMGLGFITFLALSFHLLILPSLFPAMFVSERWNIKKEIFWNLWILFTISTGYFFYCKFMGLMNISFNMVIKLILAAILPITVLIITNHNRMLKAHLKLANELTRKLRDNKLIQDKIIRFDSDYQKDSLAIKVSLLLLIRSANNYIEVFWKDGEEIRKQMVRCSITRAEEMLKEDKFIFKCHRSYIVNINYIEKIEGNLQGYKLYMEKLPTPVPVSKNYANKLNELI